MVKHEKQLKNIDGNFLLIELQIGKCPAMCTRVSNKLVLSHKVSMKGHDDALPKLRITCWQWYNTVLLLASKELPIALVLPKQQCGESCKTLVCIPFTSNIPKLCSQMNILHGKNFVTGSCTIRSSAGKFYSQMKLSSTRME
jgi:hypothetical protein